MIWKRDEAVEGQPEIGGRQMAEQNGEVTIVGQGAKLEGNIVSAGSLRIDGQVRGQINADGDVMLSAQSNVEATISAANVMVSGRLKGDVNAKGKVELARGGRVDGNITAKALVIQEGGIFNGQSVMDQTAGASGAASPAQAKSAEASKPQG
jgi:cytoskeletal protein CcmA (bactofilin family)